MTKEQIIKQNRDCMKSLGKYQQKRLQQTDADITELNSEIAILSKEIAILNKEIAILIKEKTIRMLEKEKIEIENNMI